MKKYLLYLSCIVAIIFLVGCSMDNTPTKKVENFLNSYKNLDSDVTSQMEDIINKDTTMTDEGKEKYRDILKKQYQDMTYTIKDETIDGDNATVTVEIEVYDLSKVNTASDKYYEEHPDEFKDSEGNIVDSLFVDYRIKQLEKAEDRVKYTIDFGLTKINNEWTINTLDNSTIQKLHGLYA